MNRTVTLICFILYFGTNMLSQTDEYYLSIKIDSLSAIDQLTQIVSIDNVLDNTVIAYANDNELAKLQKAGYNYTLLEHPSAWPAKSIIMAETVDQMSNWDKYPTYEVYCELMQKFESDYPDLCRAENMGTSIRNRIIWALKISADVDTDKPKPEILFSSTMHGDETSGWILCMRLADYLLSNYGTNSRITEMLDSTTIYIAPNTNPDGTYYAGNNTVVNSRRYNANSIDINRDFPDPREGANTPYAKETQIMMDFAENHHFVLAINYHGGAELINYPWDTWRSTVKKHADHSWYVQTCRKYADTVQANSPYGYFTDQNNGITNGGDWYVISGGRQDYMNYWHHCREFTLEVSSVKLLAVEQLNSLWDYNREAMLSFIENVNQGVRGFVTDENGNPLSATVTVVDYDMDNSSVVTNAAHGNYCRMLPQGTYTFCFESYGHLPQTVSGITVESNNTTHLNIRLLKEKTYTVAGTVKCLETGDPVGNVSVTLFSTPSQITHTDTVGNFNFLEIPKGEYRLAFAKTGYYSVDTLITLNGDDVNALNISLTPFKGFSFEDGVIPEGFSLSGDTEWYVTDLVAFDGTKSIRSGAISNSQSSTMEYTFNCETEGELTFYAKISTETGGKYDYLEFFIDNESKLIQYGEINWQQYSFPVTAGNHTLKWRYSRDTSAGGISNAIWVDFISIPQNTSQTSKAMYQPNHFRIHPNPAKGSITLLFNRQGSSAQLQIYSAAGYKLHETVITKSPTVFNLSETGIITSGIYLFQLKTDKAVETLKVVVK